MISNLTVYDYNVGKLIDSKIDIDITGFSKLALKVGRVRSSD